MTFLFWVSLFIIFYTFIGYGIVLYLIVKLKRSQHSAKHAGDPPLPTCTIIVAAYNEEDFIHQKVINTISLDYPPELVKYIFITDGSSDETPAIVSGFPQVHLMHLPERRGKVAAINRAMKDISSDIVIFTDANTLLNRSAVLRIVRHYSNPKVGGVAGEKRLQMTENEDARGAGEGLYWKYESALKKWDSELLTVVGAAGELFSIRRELFENIEPDTILDDFMISMRIAQKGFRIAYEPGAFAVETGSENMTEELKRKIRIAAGGIQSVIRLRALFNIFKYGILSFQYISHRVLRWTITPPLLALTLILNIYLTMDDVNGVYTFLLACQATFYMLAAVGYFFETRKIRLKVLFIPYYFCIMNYAIIAGIIKYFSGRQSAVWDKSNRRVLSLPESKVST